MRLEDARSDLTTPFVGGKTNALRNKQSDVAALPEVALASIDVPA
jgi:hypothetical protein